MLASFLIGLREGLEASLVVGIVIAYLVKTGRRDRVPAVWVGVGAAVGLSLLVGGALTLTSTELDEEAGEVFGGVMSLVAVAFVTWMIFWMRRTARSITAELHGRLDRALGMGALALGVTAFVAVGREGLETALFVWSAASSARDGAQPLVGAVLGLALSVALGWLLYRRAVRIDLATFFRWTGVALVVVAAGVLAYAVGELQDVGLLPGKTAIAFDVSSTLGPGSLAAAFMRGIFNISPAMSWLQVLAWLGYTGVVLTLLLRPRAAASRPAGPPARGTADAARAASGGHAASGSSARTGTRAEQAASGSTVVSARTTRRR